MWLLFFFLGFAASQYLHKIGETRELAKGQRAVINYQKEVSDAKQDSDNLIDKLKSEANDDGPVAPVINRYFDLMREQTKDRR